MGCKESNQTNKITKVSLISFLRVKAKQCRPRSDTYWVIWHAFWLSALFFFKVIFFKKISRLSNILGPNLAQGFVGRDLGPSYLQRSSAGIKIVGKVLKFTFFVGHRQIV